jgi:serpin B
VSLRDDIFYFGRRKFKVQVAVAAEKRRTNMKKIIFILFWVGCVTGVSCYGAVDSNSIGKALVTDGNDIREAVAGNTEFAFDLYGKLRNKTPKGNLFFSPYSLSTALSMTYAGARGDTEKQMATALRFTLPGNRLYPAFGALQKQLIQENKSRGYRLLLANALWLQKGEPFLKEFLDLTQYYYGAGLSQLDFVNETEQSREKINSWVEEKTQDKIKDLIPQDGVKPDTALVLTNAIYFKGEWKTKFRWWKTRRADFNVSEKDKVKVRMMHLKKNFKYSEDEEMQVLELLYKGNEISMMVFLPRKTEGIKEIEETLTAESLNAILSKMRTREVDVYFPKFKIVWGTFALNKALIELGMPNAFDELKADFSGINGKGGLFISDVFHKAFIEVNEEGTEAAAATAVGISAAIHFEPPIFRADHPFIFIIKDNRSGSILFIGRVMNPAE